MLVLPVKGEREPVFLLPTQILLCFLRHTRTSLDFQGPTGKCWGKGQGTPALPSEPSACKAEEVNHKLRGVSIPQWNEVRFVPFPRAQDQLPITLKSDAKDPFILKGPNENINKLE